MSDTNKAPGAKVTLAETISGAVTDAISPLNKRFAALEERIVAVEDSSRDHSLPGALEETHKGESYSFLNVFRGLTEGNMERHAPMEYAMSEELYAQGVAPDSAGGFLVPAEVHNEMIVPLLLKMLIADQLGFQQIPASTTPFIVPTVESNVSNEAVAENEGSGYTEAGFGQKIAEPHTAQSYLKASRRFLQMGPGAEMLLRDMIAKELARTQNQWALSGTGASGQPIGVLNTAGVGSVSWSGVTPDDAGAYAKLLAMEGVIEDAEALDIATAMKWCVPGAFLRGLRQMKSQNASAGTESLDVNRKVFSAGTERQIIGYDYVRTNFLSSSASGEAILGDWNELVQVNWGNLSLEASNVAGDAMNKRQTHIVAYTDVDFIVRQPGAFCVATSLDLSAL
jgi:HK97 family phage major capsid protein